MSCELTRPAADHIAAGRGGLTAMKPRWLTLTPVLSSPERRSSSLMTPGSGPRAPGWGWVAACPPDGPRPDGWLTSPEPPLTRDQVELLKSDNVVAADTRTLQDLGIAPTPIELIVPDYLARYRSRPAQRSGTRAR